jgi:alkaline phosphatase
MRAAIILPFAALSLLSPATAQTIYPYDRADILAASRFDFKVEFPGLQQPDTTPTPSTANPMPRFWARPGNLSSARTARTSRL